MCICHGRWFFTNSFSTTCNTQLPPISLEFIQALIFFSRVGVGGCMGQTQIPVITLVWKNWPLKQAENCVLWLCCRDIVEKLFNVLRNSCWQQHLFMSPLTISRTDWIKIIYPLLNLIGMIVSALVRCRSYMPWSSLRCRFCCYYSRKQCTNIELIIMVFWGMPHLVPFSVNCSPFFRPKCVKTCFQSLHKNAISRLVFFPFVVNFS